ncbi:MAG: STAS domain-containing protein [Comamonas sp.]
MNTSYDTLAILLQREQPAILEGWGTAAGGISTSPKARAEATSILAALLPAIESGAAYGSGAGAWQPVKAALEELSASRAAQGTTAGSTSAFILALKQPIFVVLQKELSADTQALVQAISEVSALVDTLAQWTVDAYQRTREQLITRQQEELLELSTPVIKLWDGILAVPMIGTLDSNRTQLVMEALLQRIVETEATLAIIDITGVPTVDTLVAQHLLKTVTAIRLMGADCIISGIRPQIAQTIVHLGIDLQSVTSKATLADALALALKRNGYTFTKTK